MKEKVIRVIVATFRVRFTSLYQGFPPHHCTQNLVVKAPRDNLPAMLVAQLLPFAKNLCTRKWSDEDVVEDVQFLRDELAANFQSLTLAISPIRPALANRNFRTYDEYSSELTSGHLSWTPVHESDDFWKENATKLNDKDYEQLKCVLSLRFRSNLDAATLESL